MKCAVIVPEPFRHDEAETCRQLSSSDFTRRLEFLRADHERVYGRPFEHFYCPLLFRDEPVKLAKGHVYPQAFTGTDRKWTVQRKDVESWFGSMFEADFVQLELRGHPSFLDAALEDPKRAKQLQLKVRADGEEVPHYRKRSDVPVPADHTPVTLTSGEKTVPLILKMKESDVLAAVNRNWEIGVQKDLRLPTLVSVLKSTHLALFRLLGYQYGRSAAGHFLGYDVLGTFYLRHGRDSREGVLAAAWQHFHQFDNMARPIQEASGDFRGSVTDRKMYLCKTDAWPWALMVFLRMGPVKFTVLSACFRARARHRPLPPVSG